MIRSDLARRHGLSGFGVPSRRRRRDQRRSSLAAMLALALAGAAAGALATPDDGRSLPLGPLSYLPQ